jgi:hypothetical protein
MQDKTAIGNNETANTPSKAFREYIESLVEEVVLNGATLNDHKKYLQRYSQEEDLDYAALEKNLTDFFEVMEEWNRLKSKSSERLAKMLAKECYISESEMEKLFSTPREAREPKIFDGHEYVDLGLPSGTLWATCNVGASKPEEYGDYFAWGETATKGTYYDWDTYKYANGDNDSLTKYCNDANYGNNGFTDKQVALQAGDDAATAKWGNGWRMPSEAQWKELKNNTSHQQMTKNGMKGCLFTSKKNGQTLFLPAAGHRWDGESYYLDIGGYWSRSFDTDYPRNAWLFFLGQYGDCGMSSHCRGYGYSVRPVREK